MPLPSHFFPYTGLGVRLSRPLTVSHPVPWMLRRAVQARDSRSHGLPCGCGCQSCSSWHFCLLSETKCKRVIQEVIFSGHLFLTSYFWKSVPGSQCFKVVWNPDPHWIFFAHWIPPDFHFSRQWFFLPSISVEGAALQKGSEETTPGNFLWLKREGKAQTTASASTVPTNDGLTACSWARSLLAAYTHSAGCGACFWVFLTPTVQNEEK